MGAARDKPHRDLLVWGRDDPADPLMARNRLTTTSGWPAKATDVEISTTGLRAGAASRKVRAIAGLTPRDTSEPAIGTEAHSQPGRTGPLSTTIGTAAGFLGSIG
jgi:hypothetical protein